LKRLDPDMTLPGKKESILFMYLEDLHSAFAAIPGVPLRGQEDGGAHRTWVRWHRKGTETCGTPSSRTYPRAPWVSPCFWAPAAPTAAAAGAEARMAAPQTRARAA